MQIEVNLGEESRCDAQDLQAVLAAKPEALPEELAEAYRFAEAVVTKSGEENRLRERIQQRHGEAGLIELAMTTAVCLIFPTTKRALGYATSCSKVTVTV